MVRNERFLSWNEACRYVGDERVLNETDELYFMYTGFASVEMGEKSYDRVHVNGYLRLYPSDLKDLRSGMPVGCNSALINGFMSINGDYNKNLLEKFLVFDDELTIGVAGGDKSNLDLQYPDNIYLRESDLVKLCERFGLMLSGDKHRPASQQVKLEREQELLQIIGSLAYLLAKDRDVDLQTEWNHLSDTFIDELFLVLESLGNTIEGKHKFQYERLISEGVRFVHARLPGE
jgi:hypothetical protein